jgi:HEPN domain-containing protein
MDSKKYIAYWIETAARDHDAMQHLYENKDYHWSLFMGHLVIEKLLKACYTTNKGDQPPYIHDLVRLAEKAGLKLTASQMDKLDTITTFNIRARYDDHKLLFYKKCTKEYTEKWIIEIEELVKWIKRML